MTKEKTNHFKASTRHLVLIIGCFVFFFFFKTNAFSQTFVVGFPIGSTVYEGSEIPMTVVVEAIKCESTVIKCRRGLVTKYEGCKYLYQCPTVGIDTVEVFIRKAGKLQLLGIQSFVVKPRPLPRAYFGGHFNREKISKGSLLAQGGVGAEFYIAGSHWEPCTIESFTVVILREGVVIANIQNKGNAFTAETKIVLRQVQAGDKLLISDIKGCSDRGAGELKGLEFMIE
jgi:hypothetical protein